MAAAATLLAPATAHAAFAKSDSTGKLTYTTVPGEANRLVVTSTGPGAVQLSETGHLGVFPVLIAGSGGCSGVAAQIACTGVKSVKIDTGDGDDAIAARDGLVQHIACGSGTDAVSADAGDAVGADCESVDRGSTAASAPGAQDPPAGHDPAANDPTTPGGASSADLNPLVNLVPPAIPPQTATVTASGVALVQIVCPLAAGACKGTVRLTLLGRATRARRARAAVAAARPKATTIGSARFSAKPGDKPFIRVRLNRRGRQRILRTRHTRCRLVVTTRTAAGKATTTTRTITLARRRGRKKR
jgi:hypothetical protein